MKSRFRMMSRLGLCLGLFVVTTGLRANPTGGSVVAGSAAIAGQGTSTVTINQASNMAIINWQSFSINSGELTKFVQPSAQSAALNRVLGGQTSLIDGTLSANGKVYLINGNGIIVGPGGVINASAFTASTRDISDADFLKGNLHFTGSNNAGVQNYGTINAIGGDVALIGKTVDNQGTILAPNGTAGLVAGDDVLLAQKNADGTTITVSPAATATSASGQIGIHNSGTITTAAAELKAANGNIYALAVQNEGTIRATTVQKQGGHIWLTTDAGTVSNSGTLNASATAAGGKGGTVTLKSTTGTASHTGKIIAQGGQGGAGGNAEISGAQLQFTGLVDLTAPGGTIGTVILDPLTLTVQTGGSRNDLTASFIDPIAVDAALGTANVTLDADAAIIIASGLTWSGASVLTLQTNQSGGAIAINAPITAPSGGLTLNAAGASDSITATGAVNVANFVLRNGAWMQNTPSLPAFTASHDFEIQGGTFLRAAGGDGVANPYQIADIYGLQGLASLGENLINVNAELVNNIDATGTSTWNSGEGFVPIGNGSQTMFAGTFNGQGYAINDLDINRPNENLVGLFGAAYSGSIIENVGVTNVQIDGYNSVGGVVGYTNGTVKSSYVTGAVTGYAWVGGLVGEIGYGGMVETSHASAAVLGVSGSFGIGGLIGGIERTGTVETSYASGTVSGPSYVGGLVGYNEGKVETSYATGSVSGTSFVGGLVGYNYVDYVLPNDDAVVESSYATGSVTGTSFVGGLVGLNDFGSTLETSYSTGTVTAGSNSESVGGLVGYNGGMLKTSYATGAVLAGSGSESVGGLVGSNGYSYSGTVETSYATGPVLAGAGSQYVGGLVGYNAYSGTISASFWDTNTAGVMLGVGSDPTNTTFGVTGETTASLLQMSTYANAGWNIGTDPSSNTWVIFDGQTRPMLSMEYSTTITNAHQLQLIGLNSTTLAASYTLANDIDLNGTANQSEVWGTSFSSGAGFVPIGIGNHTSFFTGTFNGQGHSVDSLYIHVPSEYNPVLTAVGLFGAVGTGGTVENIGVLNFQVSGFTGVGGLAGYNAGTIANAYSTGTVSGMDSVGGLVGYNLLGSISNAYSSAAVNGGGDGGGLVGFNYEGVISDVYSTGAVTGGNHIGGLVGGTYYGMISNAYSTGAVTMGSGNNSAGGLVGFNEYGSINDAYSTGKITAGNGSINLGGLVGYTAAGEISNCFWDTTTSGIIASNGGINGGDNMGVTGATTAQLQTQSFIVANSSAGSWDFTPGTGPWGINGYTSTGLVNGGLPYFQWQYPTQALVTPLSQSLPLAGTLDQAAYTVTFAPGYTRLAPLLASGPTLSVVNTAEFGYIDQVGVSLTPNTGYTIEISTDLATVNYTGVAPLPPTPPILPITILGEGGSLRQSFENFSAQFNANAGYDALFRESWFPLFGAGNGGSFISVYSPGNAPHTVFSTYAAGYDGNGKRPRDVIAFGSSLSVSGQSGGQ